MWWLLMLPTMLVIRSSSGVILDPSCTVTDLQVHADNNTSSIQYSTTLANATKCRETDNKPNCNTKYPLAKLIDCERNRTLTIWHLKHKGWKCYPNKACLRIKCGSVVSDAVRVPGINVEVNYQASFWNASTLKMSISPHNQVAAFEVKVMEKNNHQTIIAKSNSIEKFHEVLMKGNYTPGTHYDLRIIPTLLAKDNNCIEEASIGKVYLDLDPVDPDCSPNHMYITLGVVSGILVIVILLVVFAFCHQKRPDPDNNTLVLVSHVKHDHVVLIVHTQESPNLRVQVKKLINKIITKTNVKQVSDIFDIQDHQILSNAKPWLLDQLYTQEQTYVILVCSSGLFTLLKAIRRGDNDADAVGCLGRTSMPSDFLLLAFLRFLNDSSPKLDYKRLLAIRFEDNEYSENIPEEQEEGMREIGISSRLYRLPYHYPDLQKALSTCHVEM